MRANKRITVTSNCSIVAFPGDSHRHLLIKSANISNPYFIHFDFNPYGKTGIRGPAT